MGLQGLLGADTDRSKEGQDMDVLPRVLVPHVAEVIVLRGPPFLDLRIDHFVLLDFPSVGDVILFEDLMEDRDNRIDKLGAVDI